MRYLVKPVLIEFESDGSGNQITLWSSTPLTKFLAKVNDCNHVFLSTGIERLLYGKWVRGFKAYPVGSKAVRNVDLSDCRVAVLGGALRAEDVDKKE